MYITIYILSVILLFSSIICLLAGLFMLFAIKSFSDFEEYFRKKYFTAPADSSTKSYSFVHNFIFKQGQATGLILMLLGTYFLFCLVKMAIILI